MEIQKGQEESCLWGKGTNQYFLRKGKGRTTYYSLTRYTEKIKIKNHIIKIQKGKKHKRTHRHMQYKIEHFF
jgi:hypothetical protein